MHASVKLTQQLIRFNTVNPPGAERPCAEHLAALLVGAGFAVELIPFGEGQGNISRVSAGRRISCRSDLPATSIPYRSARSPGLAIHLQPISRTANSMGAALRT